MLWRRFTLVNPDGGREAYSVEWDLPAEEGNSWYCTVHAEGPEDDLTFQHRVGGVDPAQVLSFIPLIVEASLSATKAVHDGRLYWLDPESGLGLGSELSDDS